MSGLDLDGHSLTLDELVRAARDPAVEVGWTEDAARRVARSRRQIEAIVERYEAARAEAGDSLDGIVLDYGVTTGFGSFKNVAIEPAELQRLQRNILLSHSVGVGAGSDPDDPDGYFPAEVVRAALVLRLNTFLNGHSGSASRWSRRSPRCSTGGSCRWCRRGARSGRAATSARLPTCSSSSSARGAPT